MAEPARLVLFSETKFDHRVRDQFPATCPTVDLTATWDATGKNLLICRPRDQIVLRIHQTAPPGTTAPEPQAVRWKPNGMLPAISPPLPPSPPCWGITPVLTSARAVPRSRVERWIRAADGPGEQQGRASHTCLSGLRHKDHAHRLVVERRWSSGASVREDGTKFLARRAIQGSRFRARWAVSRSSKGAHLPGGRHGASQD